MNATAPKSTSCVISMMLEGQQARVANGLSSEIHKATHTGVEGVGEFVKMSVEPRRSINLFMEGVLSMQV